MIASADARRQRMAAAAAASERASGVPAEIVYAQAAIESGWLRFAPGNNAFGVKWSGREGDSRQLLRTTEWLAPDAVDAWVRARSGREMLAQVSPPDARGRALYRVRDWFAAYASLDDSFAAHARLLMGPRYASIAQAYAMHRDIAVAGRALARAGYSTTAPEAYGAALRSALAWKSGEALIASSRMIEKQKETVV